MTLVLRVPAAGAYSGTGESSAWFWCAATGLGLAAAVAFRLLPDLPPGIPFDERLKAELVLNGSQNFRHPILMLQLVRLANLWVGAADLPNVIDLGRAVAAAFGGLTVFAAMALARRAVGPHGALGAGVLTAVTPLCAFHAQLFKEDIFVAPWLLLGVLAIDRLREDSSSRHAILVGLTQGLAASAKYVGVVLLPLGLLLPLLVAVGCRSRYYAMTGLAAAIGFGVFCIVNAPLFSNPSVFVDGLSYEIDHATTRHVIAYPAWHSHLVFTWNANLWPGLRAPIALAGLLGALLVSMRWRASPPSLRLLLLLGVAWYLMHELSPMKPYPEGARHMTVMAAALAILAVLAVERAADALEHFPEKWAPVFRRKCDQASNPERVPARGIAESCSAFSERALAPAKRAVAVVAAIAGLGAVPAWTSWQIARSAPDDTQLVAERIAAALDAPTAWADRAALRPYAMWLDMSQPIDTEEQTAGYGAVKEAFAQLYLYSITLPDQPESVRQVSAQYAALMRRPALLITSTAGSFAYRNMAIRIVALKGDAESLARAVATIGPVAGVELRLIRGALPGEAERRGVDGLGEQPQR